MKYRIDLTSYDVKQLVFETKDDKREQIMKNIPCVVKDELYAILRMPGVYKDGVETCDGVALAKNIQNADDSIEIEAKELELIKRIFNKLIAQEHNPQTGQAAMGGERYIELIIRIFKAEEISE